MCSEKDKGMGDILLENLSENEAQTSLVLFISEGMCSECIMSEFINLKENAGKIKSLTVVGAFANVRHFHACVNAMNYEGNIKKVYINTSKTKKIQLPKGTFYVLYKREANSLSEIFYPQSCERDATVKYYISLQNKY
jgi:hypothetical protein